MATKCLYFMEETDGAFNAAYDAYCPNVSRLRSFNSTGTTTTTTTSTTTTSSSSN